MAITIINPPTRPTEEDRPVYTRTCPECGCTFTYKYSDCIDSNWRGGYVAVHCPHCKYPVAHIYAGGGDDINYPIINDSQQQV